MPSPFLPLERFSELNRPQQETLEIVAGFFMDARTRPISHIMNISYMELHMSTLLISSDPGMRNNLFHAGQQGEEEDVLRLMDQMVGLAGGNDNLQKVIRAAFTINGWDLPLEGVYRVVEAEGCIGFEINGTAFFVLRTAKAVDLATLASMDFTLPGLFAFLNPLSARDSLSELH